MVYARRRRKTPFRSVRGRYRRRPTAYRKKPSYWKRRLSRRKAKGAFATRRSQLAKLTWVGTYDHNFAAAPGFIDTIIRLNSVYDPQYAVGGGTPTGLAQLATMWGQYKVNAAKVTVKFVNNGSLPALVGMYTCDDSYSTPATAILNLNKLYEQDFPHKTIFPASYGQASIATFSRFYRIKRICDPTRVQDQNLCSGIATNPSTQAHLHVVSLGDTGAAIPGGTSTTRVYITVRYYSKFMLTQMPIVD